MRTVCVYTPQFAASTKKANRCFSSGKEFGVDVELFPSVYYKDIISACEDLKIKLRYTPHYKGVNTNFRKMSAPASRIANGITHYSLYKWSAENDEPITILEHDSYFVGQPADPIENGIIQVSSHTKKQLNPESLYNCGRAKKMKKCEPNREYNWNWPSEGVITHPLSGLNGTSGYVVCPKAAKKMKEYIEATGVGFADRIRTEHLGEGNLYLQIPQSVFCASDIQTSKMMSKEK